jgi:5-methylcytosine-specific restriction endonuclease McrA
LKQFTRKRPRLRLDRDAYRQLTRQVLARDGWRCQDCGTARDLQVHHMRSRGRLGNDAEENLITLCAGCHQAKHLHRQVQ